MGLRSGGHVFDLCCGARAAALAGARVVGGSGHVVAVDLSPHPEPADAVRDAVLGELRRRNVQAVTTNVVYGRAKRASEP
jgi:predicted RNA methylase